MGQGLSCGEYREPGLYSAIHNGELETVEGLVDSKPGLLQRATGHARLLPLHVAAANGQIQVLSMLLDRSANPDVLNRHKQTPLMLAAMHGHISCFEKLIEVGANLLMFDSLHGRTCLHYAAHAGRSDGLQAILSAAQSSPVANSWGFTRFVNIRDKKGATPLHLAAQQGQTDCVHILLDCGALVSASTGGYGYPGNTPLHLAARGGSLDCVRKLLAWGADRLDRDFYGTLSGCYHGGRLPYMVALKHKHRACAALLNPSAPEPLIWPAPLKFIAELNPEAKALLERALIETNREREKSILEETVHSPQSPLNSEAGAWDSASEASEAELCCICFERVCSIEVQTCGHQMCARCTLALCCHKKPTHTTLPSVLPKAPICPFCRSNITQLTVANFRTKSDDTATETEFSPPRISPKSFGVSECSSSCKSLPTLGSLGKLGRRSFGKVSAECEDEVDKV